MVIDLNSITSFQKLVIAKGLCDYQFIMDNWHTDSSDFRRVYYDFYLKARWAVMTNEGNSEPYFKKLQTILPDSDLISIITDLKKEMLNESYELSVGSKLLHTRNPNSPIYDSKVREYLGKNENVEFWWNRSKEMYGSSAPRGISEFDKIKHDWESLCEWYNQFLKSSRCKEWIDWFDYNFPNHKTISKIKKTDFIIFAAT